MAEEKQNSGKSSLSQAASAAGNIKGAMKAGKALAGATKGAAAGPYGMLAAGLWENRKLIGIIIAACAALLMLPVLYILMLPSLIFGGIGSKDKPNRSLTDNNVITENITEVEQAVEEILRKKYKAVVEKIEAEARKLGENTQYSITDEFSDMIIFQSTLIISQFCTSQDNYKEINLSKLKSILEDKTDSLFSYHVNITTYEQEIPMSVNENSTETQTVTITHYDYIIDYEGDSYYAEHVFLLTAEQLAKADEYTSNLHLFLYETVYKVKINPDLLPDLETGNAIVDLALTTLGTPYSQDKRNQEGYFDCSSFTYWVLSSLGINLSYEGSDTAASQGRYIVENNLAVSYDSLAPGDLIFYSFKINNRYLHIDHVAIYCGNGYVVDASSSKRKVVYRPIYNTNRIVLCGRPYAG